MANTFTYVFDLQAKNKKILSQINGVKEGLEKSTQASNKAKGSFTKTFDSLQKKINTIQFSSILNQINAVSDGLNSLSGPGMEFSTSMANMSALTGVTGSGLQELGKFARTTAKDFGITASGAVESFQSVLSKLDPQLAKSPRALNKMGQSIATLSKQMGGDAAAAADVLTTAMNQYQVSTDDPIAASKKMTEMMNVMSAAAKEGSATLPAIQAALSQSGLAAKVAGVSFQEANAAIQVLDKGGKKGAEAGVALRNVMTTLSQGRFLPPDVKENLQAAGIDVGKLTDKSLSLAERLKPLQGIMSDTALMTKLFGRENSNAAIALISNIDKVQDMTKAITGTNNAYEQAAVIMESPAEKAKRLQARIDDLKLSIFAGTNGLLGYTGVLSDVGKQIFYLMPLYDGLKAGVMGAVKAVKFLTSAEKLKSVWDGIVTASTKVWTVAQRGLNLAMKANPIGIIITVISALVGVITLAWNKSEEFRKVIMGLWEVLKSFGNVIKDYVITRFKELLSGITGIGRALMLFFKGKWKDAWETGKKAVVDLSGIHSAKGAVENAKKAGREIGENYAKGESEAMASWAKNHKKIVPDNGILPKIKNPKVPGTTNPTNNGTGANTSSSSAAVNPSNKAIATGGTKNTTVNISIGNVVKNFSVKTGNLPDAVEKIRDKIVEEITKAISMGASLAS